MGRKKSHSQTKIHPHPTHVGHVIHDDEKNYKKKDDSGSDSDGDSPPVSHSHHSHSHSPSAEDILTEILDPLDTLLFIYSGEMVEIGNKEQKVLFHMVAKQSGTLWDQDTYSPYGWNHRREGQGEIPLYDYFLVTPDNKTLLYLKRHTGTGSGAGNQNPAYQIYTGKEDKIIADFKYYSSSCFSNASYWVTPMSLFTGAGGQNLIEAQGNSSGCCGSASDFITFFSPDLGVVENPNNNNNNNNFNRRGQVAVGEMRKNYQTGIATLSFRKDMSALHKMSILVMGWQIFRDP